MFSLLDIEERVQEMTLDHKYSEEFSHIDVAELIYCILLEFCPDRVIES